MRPKIKCVSRWKRFWVLLPPDWPTPCPTRSAAVRLESYPGSWVRQGDIVTFDLRGFYLVASCETRDGSLWTRKYSHYRSNDGSRVGAKTSFGDTRATYPCLPIRPTSVCRQTHGVPRDYHQNESCSNELH